MTTETEPYPSPAARYGVEQLMAMAGTLAEKAEQDIPVVTPSGETPQVSVLVAQAYGILALTQAVRDLPEQVAEALARELRAMDADQVSYGEVQ